MVSVLIRVGVTWRVGAECDVRGLPSALTFHFLVAVVSFCVLAITLPPSTEGVEPLGVWLPNRIGISPASCQSLRPGTHECFEKGKKPSRRTGSPGLSAVIRFAQSESTAARRNGNAEEEEEESKSSEKGRKRRVGGGARMRSALATTDPDFGSRGSPLRVLVSDSVRGARTKVRERRGKPLLPRSPSPLLFPEDPVFDVRLR